MCRYAPAIGLTFLMLVMVLSPSCKKKSGTPAGTLLMIQGLYVDGKSEEAETYFTRGTLKAMQEIEKMLPGQKSHYGAEKLFMKGAEWDVLSDKISGDRAEIQIRFTSHPVENLLGFVVTMKMKREDGLWKRDMEDELRNSIPLLRQIKSRKR